MVLEGHCQAISNQINNSTGGDNWQGVKPHPYDHNSRWNRKHPLSRIGLYTAGKGRPDVAAHGLKWGRSKKHEAGKLSVPPPQPPSNEKLNQRTAFVGAAGVILGLAALALWSAQAWRLPWQRQSDEETPAATEGGDVVQVDLAAIVDDQRTRPESTSAEEEREMEIKRLQAARVALERRLSQLSGSKDRRSGIPTPYVPQSERPWRETGYQEALAEALKAGVAIDPTANVSLQWDDPDTQQTAFEMQQELDQRPIEDIDEEEAELRTALDDLEEEGAQTSEESSDVTTSASPDVTEKATEDLLPEASDLSWTQEGVTAADLASRRPEEAEQQKGETAEHKPADDAEVSGRQDEKDGEQAGPSGQAAIALPDLSASAEGSREEDLLPTPSETNFKQEIATPEERTAAAVGVSISETEFIRRSQKPVTKVDGQLRLVAAGASAPAPHKMRAGKSGEDAFFVSEALWGAMGVADGVGSWTQDGIDPSLFSRRLLEVAAAATEHGWGRREAQGARGLMHIAQIGAIDVEGTSTVCIAQMMLGRSIQIANLGDSGFRIFRDGKCIFGSEVQRHSFNCPYQAGSPKLHPHTNGAKDAEVYELEVRENDLVLMATDGIYDNLWDYDLEDIISSYLEEESGDGLDSGDAAAIATRVIGEASNRGSDPEARTPWIVDTAKQKPELLPWNIRLRPRGGKPDDCTAVVAFLQRDENQY